MTPQRVLIVRHGESTWNALRKWQGRADPPLSARGESQAARAALAAPSQGAFECVVTSSLERARQTGAIIAERLGIELGAALDGLAERDAGEWQGLTRAEIDAAYPGYLDEDRRPDGYEHDESVVARASDALRSVARDTADGVGDVLVVSHGGVIHALERAAFGSDTWQRLDNLTGRWFDVHDDMIEPVGDRIALVPDGGPAIPPPAPGYA